MIAAREKRATHRDAATGTTAVSGGAGGATSEAGAEGAVEHRTRVHREAAKAAAAGKGRRATRRRAPTRGRRLLCVSYVTLLRLACALQAAALQS
jgi:hypothetical protein